jgi:hypothetical protein
MLRSEALVRTDVSEEGIASIIRVTRIGELRTTLAVTSNRSTLHIIFLHNVLRLLFTANADLSSPIKIILIIVAIYTSKRRFLQEPQGVTSQKTAFFLVTAVKRHRINRLDSAAER